MYQRLLNVFLTFFLTCLIGLAQSENPLYESEALSEYYEQISKESLQWGPYRSNLYLGIRPRIPDSFLSGLIWFPADKFDGMRVSRHECNQHDNIKTFGWKRYDPRIGGREIIVDGDIKLNITADFVKTDDGKSWALKIRGKAENPESVNSVVFYASVEDEAKLILKNDYIEDAIGCLPGKQMSLRGSSDKLGGAFNIDIIEKDTNVHAHSKNKKDDLSFDPFFTHHLSLNVPQDEQWQANDIFWTLIKMNAQELQESSVADIKDYSPTEIFQLRNTQGFEGNTHFIQKTFVGDFEYSILFNMNDSPKKLTDGNIQSKIELTLDDFSSKFSSKFQLQAPYTDLKYVNFAKEILSQLMGGIGYFHGNQLVDRHAEIDEVSFTESKLKGNPEGPYELFTSVPSRPFFARGFLWDEGFQLLPILEYDSDLALEIVKSWFSLIDDDGWIAREQILGEEARSKVPEQFIAQNPNIANPPTLMMLFTQLLDDAKKLHEQQISGSNEFIDSSVQLDDDLRDKLGDLHMEKPQLMISYAEEIYEKLQRHYEWFRRTQRGETEDLERGSYNKEELYRWKGRTKDLCLPSGLDDYPRCEPDIAELNIDLMTWIAVMTRSMHRIALLLEKHEDAELYNRRYYLLVGNMNALMWSDNDKSYCDVTVDDDDHDIFECHIGYVTMMPFVHRVLPPFATKPLLWTLEKIRDPKQLWSPYGIRSLSKKDAFFHSREDYWRGHIWLNINYLALDALYYYGKHPEVDQSVKDLANEIYIELRQNLVNNVYNEYQKTGYAWEQYNEKTGEGQRTKAFLGWTSLVVLMMKMPERIF